MVGQRSDAQHGNYFVKCSDETCLAISGQSYIGEADPCAQAASIGAIKLQIKRFGVAT